MKSLLHTLGTLSAVLLLSACSVTVNTKTDKEGGETDGAMMEDDAMMDHDEMMKGDSMMMEEDERRAEEQEDVGDDPGEGDDAMMKMEMEMEMKMEPEPEAGAADASANHVIRITAENWAFKPNLITVQQGENVTIELVGMSGVHGLSVEGLGISAAVPAGQTMLVNLPTDKPGEYAFYCSIPCGSGHKEMVGTIVILPA